MRSREKGQEHERAVADALRAAYPGAKRGLGQARAGGEVPDVTGTPFWVECKHRRRCNIRGAFEQALVARKRAALERCAARNACEHRWGAVLVVTRDDAKSDLATVTLDTFVGLVAELERLRRAVDAALEEP